MTLLISPSLYPIRSYSFSSSKPWLQQPFQPKRD
uniref:Uncharacterized protein n=1 Tax=Rhizophora mucronata TaxID=61149 RepID=A0A2P2N523_RHIMU